MIEEQLLEVNKKIKQIQGVINRRKEKVSQWNLNYKKVIEDRPDKSYYLQKNCASRILFKNLKPQQYDKKKSQLQKKVSQSRLKIRIFYNELKNLDDLAKQKTKIRLLSLQKKNENKQNISKSQQNSRNVKQKQKSFGNQNSNILLCRTIKDYKCSPFKPQKFTQFAQTIKATDQNIGPKIMKYFGVGLETTPLGHTLNKQEKKEDYSNKSNKKKYLKNKMSKTCFGKKFVSAFQNNQKIFGMTYQPRNIFEDRMRKIIKYHGDFWDDELKIN